VGARGHADDPRTELSSTRAARCLVPAWVARRHARARTRLYQAPFAVVFASARCVTAPFSSAIVKVGAWRARRFPYHAVATLSRSVLSTAMFLLSDECHARCRKWVGQNDKCRRHRRPSRPRTASIEVAVHSRSAWFPPDRQCRMKRPSRSAVCVGGQEISMRRCAFS
jgi:hypothetical protein